MDPHYYIHHDMGGVGCVMGEAERAFLSVNWVVLSVG